MIKPKVGKTYRVIDVPESIDCQKCNPCLRLKMMELGFICGETIKIKKHQFGIWLVSVLSSNGDECQSIGLRNEEMDRIVLEEIMPQIIS